uniref:Uncharacterized protein n=1 Tax=Anguilla anguilla TaxID=7936 RepID=A0A0E9STH8_ANGAN
MTAFYLWRGSTAGFLI